MPTFRSEHDDLIRRLREKSKLFDRGTAERPEVWFLLREAADALEAAQRPPVTPEVREEVRAVVGEQLTKAGLDLDGPPYNDDGESQWPVALELRDRLTDALLARFPVPSQPMYDEEKIARWLMREFGVSNGTQAWMEFQGSASSLAAALVAALRGGELTRKETNHD